VAACTPIVITLDNHFYTSDTRWLAFAKWEEKEEIIGKDRRGKIFAILEKIGLFGRNVERSVIACMTKRERKTCASRHK